MNYTKGPPLHSYIEYLHPCIMSLCYCITLFSTSSGPTIFLQGKHPPSAQAMTQLLDMTRDKRVQWLKEELVSIEAIFEKYPCLKTSKWVCDIIKNTHDRMYARPHICAEWCGLWAH